MKYICSWSGGKDSTASIILAHENNEPLDVIVFSEVMYDIKRNISGELPRHIDFIRNVAKPLFESWGYEVIILRAKTDYLDNFNKIVKNPRKHPENKGKRRGFVVSGLCSIKRDCKEKPIKEYYKSLNDDYTQYAGICIDEPARLNSMHKTANKVSLLEKYGYTEKMARALCEKYGLLSPSYELTNRSGCWMCPNSKLDEQMEIQTLYPEIWEEFVALEKEQGIAIDKWNSYGSTLEERNEQMLSLNRQLTIFDFLERSA